MSDLFSCMLAKIQVLMLQNDILELQNNPNYSLDNSNSVYVIFMLIGIIGYFTVPTVAGWIVQAGGCRKLQPKHQPYRDQDRRICSRCRSSDWEISEGVCVENKLNRNIKIMENRWIFKITDQYLKAVSDGYA